MYEKILYFNYLEIIVTYISLLYQKNILVDRIVVDKLGKVEVIAGGIPLLFLIDGETSPSWKYKYQFCIYFHWYGSICFSQFFC